MSYNLVNPTTGDLTRVAGGTLYADNPIGTIISSGAAWDNPPAGYLFCGGQAVSRVTYAALFAVVGTTFGAGDGSTTFNVPELRGEFLRGAGTNQHAGQGNGGAPGYHQDATEIQGAIIENTTHRIVFGHSATDNTPVVKKFDTFNLGDISGVTYYTKEADIEGAEFVNYLSVRPTNTSVNFFIKATNVAVPADFINSVDEAVEEAMYYQRGVIENIEVLAGSMKLVRVNFDTLMPDGEYCVDIEPYNTLDAQCIPVGANERRTDHFNIIIRNISSTNVTNLKITWQAFRIPH